MPTTKLQNGIVRNLNNNDGEQMYDTFESNPSRNNAFTKKSKLQNSIKSFWSSNLSLASSTSSSSSSQNNTKSNNLINTSKKLFRDLIARSPSPAPSSAGSRDKAKQSILTRSHTMRPNQRRRLFNRSSSRNLTGPVPANLNLSQHQVSNSPAANTNIIESNNLYDKLFVNNKLNVINKQLVKQIDDELSPYSHISKDFTVDCLKPFFQIDRIEKIQLENSVDIPNTSKRDSVQSKLNTEYDEGTFLKTYILLFETMIFLKIIVITV